MAKKKKIEKKTSSSKGMVRAFGPTLLLVGAVVAVLLVAVWKEVVITDLSLSAKMINDSLVSLSAQEARLQLTAEKLSNTNRIEKIASQSLGLIYPHSENIELVGREEKMQTSSESYAHMRRSRPPDKS